MWLVGRGRCCLASSRQSRPTYDLRLIIDNDSSSPCHQRNHARKQTVARLPASLAVGGRTIITDDGQTDGRRGREAEWTWGSRLGQCDNADRMVDRDARSARRRQWTSVLYRHVTTTCETTRKLQGNCRVHGILATTLRPSAAGALSLSGQSWANRSSAHISGHNLSLLYRTAPLQSKLLLCSTIIVVPTL